MNKQKFTGLLCSIVACGIPARLLAGNITEIDIFKNQVFTQTSGSAPGAPTGFFANIELTSAHAGDFDAVSVSYPGPASPTSLTPVLPSFWSFGPSFATQADMDLAVPAGAYVYTATNSVTSDSETATLNYTGDAFGSAIPALTAGTWNALNGLDPSSALAVDFNTFTPGAATTPGNGFVFFTISNASGTAFTDGFLDPASGGLLLPANTLLPNTTYNFELDFSDRQTGTDAASGAFTLVGSDLRDEGTFTTGSIAAATPEPSTWMLLGSGFVALAALRRRR